MLGQFPLGKNRNGTAFFTSCHGNHQCHPYLSVYWHQIMHYDQKQPSWTGGMESSLIYLLQTTATILTRGASMILIVFLCITLTLFAFARIWDNARIIHFNMELSLLLAHVCLLPSSLHETSMCRLVSILIHFFYQTCFTFMFLESLHLYAWVGWVVKRWVAAAA